MKRKISKIITVCLSLFILIFLFEIRVLAEESEPISLSVTLKEGELYAYEKLDGDTVSAFLSYSDGKMREISFEDLKIEYEKGDSLRASDTGVLVSYLDFSVSLPVSVLKSNYDMTGAAWVNTNTVYDGAGHTPTLVGLPEGVRVLEYAIVDAIDAGTYGLSASFTYEKENYNPPVCPDGTLVIEPQSLDAPVLESLVYNGQSQSPTLNSPFFTAESVPQRDAGKYPVHLKISDGNYSFSGSLELMLYYEILPREIEIEISDIDTYYFERDFSPSYTVVRGEILAGDELSPVFEIYGDRIFISAQNQNYRLVYAPGKITHHQGFSKGGAAMLFIIILLTLAVVLLILSLFLCRYRIKSAFMALRLSLKRNGAAELKIPEGRKKTYTEGLSITRERADGLISDSLAKSLVKDTKIVYSTGRRHAVINLDTVSAAFVSGEVVDVNSLKERGLVREDVAYIKVLARGSLDKSLFVYANAFSSSAIKMIALSGGEAHRAVTKIKR